MKKNAKNKTLNVTGKLLPKRYRWLIISDLDGTFLKSGSTHQDFNINPKNIEVIKKLESIGHKIAFVTGRPWNDTKQIYKAAGLETIVGNYNGAMITDPTDKGFVPIKHTISRSMVAEMLSEPLISKAVTNMIIEYESHPEILNIKDKEMMDQFHILDNPKLKKLKSINDIKENPFSIILKIDDSKYNHSEVLKVAKRKYGNAFALRFWVTKDEKYFLEVNSKAINKAKAAEIIATYYNISQHKIIALGDGMNDIEMLQYAAHGVAMKNANEVVKSYARDITDFSNDEGGVGRYLEKFFEYDLKFADGDLEAISESLISKDNK